MWERSDKQLSLGKKINIMYFFPVCLDNYAAINLNGNCPY